jgi:hypothetical protein
MANEGGRRTMTELRIEVIVPKSGIPRHAGSNAVARKS